MLELLLCSLVTIFPDYLFRRYVQGRRIGKEITFYSVWFELRWGIIACLMLTVGLITVIFYNHPSTSSVTLLFRTVPIVSEINGRVAEVYVGLTGEVKQGAPIFRLDSSTQQAAAEAALQPPWRRPSVRPATSRAASPRPARGSTRTCARSSPGTSTPRPDVASGSTTRRSSAGIRAARSRASRT